MRTNILLLLCVFIVLGCETGTKYKEGETVKKSPHEPASGLVDRTRIDALLDEDEPEERKDAFERDMHPIVFADKEPKYVEPKREEYIEEESFDEESDERVETFYDGLDVRNIREGKHDDYMRLVFDIYHANEQAKKVGQYTAKYYESRDDIVVTLKGYNKFTAALPSFSVSSPVEQLYFERYHEENAYKFHIKLREHAKVRIFALENPARLVFDIKPI
jgi:hypothetical protein